MASESVQQQALKELFESHKWLNVLGVTKLSKVRNGETVELHFDRADGTSFSAPLDLVITQGLFRRKVFSATGYPIPNQGAATWDLCCSLMYQAAGDEIVRDSRTAETLDLLADFFSSRTEHDRAEDMDVERVRMEGLKAGTTRAFVRQDGRYVFKLSELIDHARRHGSLTKRPELVANLSLLGFDKEHTRDTRVWLSPVDFTTSVTD